MRGISRITQSLFRPEMADHYKVFPTQPSNSADET